MISRFRKLRRYFPIRESVSGVCLSFAVWSIGCFYIWYAEAVDVWFYNTVLGIEYSYQLDNEGQIRARRALAVGLFVSLVLSHGAYLFFLIREKIRRRRAKKSAQGQWYDTDSLSKEDLYADKDVDDESK
ncbi:hypothetical protein [Thiopseudomonas denitrificans]|uniref:Uncharacterized protein n=1 Tax=Thiopseudomonas denitrificans TaxID=1501432 RepID=A0A4R6U0W6_9GAMM|nr:hypothetical protein [Thiopseudomonas denitrificans]TDQ38263.1 hypothetical protein DFQ45_105178 [Thiopseudomonas denitrificans]